MTNIKELKEDLNILCLVNLCLVILVFILLTVSLPFSFLALIALTAFVSLVYNLDILCKLYPQIPASIKQVYNHEKFTEYLTLFMICVLLFIVAILTCSLTLPWPFKLFMCLVYICIPICLTSDSRELENIGIIKSLRESRIQRQERFSKQINEQCNIL